MITNGYSTPKTGSRATYVRDPFARRDLLADALKRPMSERLELALNWNKLASELRIGLANSRRSETGGT